MLREQVKDAGAIIQNILKHHLALPNVPPDTSLLSAAQSYSPDTPQSTLYSVLRSFLDYPESTDTLLTELRLIADDLR
jgi:hypothetical protein